MVKWVLVLCFNEEPRMSSSFGHLFRITTFGESHGQGIGVVIDGCPGCIPVSLDQITLALQKRRPGGDLSSARAEPDIPECLSGIENGISLGTPICLIIRNKDARPQDYQNTTDHYRNSHADYTTQHKYGIRPSSGGGRASARETAARVMGGSVARQYLEHLYPHFKLTAFVSRTKDVACDLRTLSTLKSDDNHPLLDTKLIMSSKIRCADHRQSQNMIRLIKDVQDKGDTVGGEICCVGQNIPLGLGEPVFDKLNADLAKAMMSLPAARYFAQGATSQSTWVMGSQNNDPLSISETTKQIIHTTNNTGGIEGGISNGAPLIFRVGFKPPSSTRHIQSSVSHSADRVQYSMTGRHDPCVLPRAVPIVEAMSCLVLADHHLRQLSFKTSLE